MSHLNLQFLTNKLRAPGVGDHSHVLNFSDDRLERQHNYIQWMFPLATPSKFQPDIPTLNKFSIHAIRQHPDAVANLCAGLELMSGFYNRTENWTDPNDHNQYRITRILASSTILIDIQLAREWFRTFAPQSVRKSNKRWAIWV